MAFFSTSIKVVVTSPLLVGDRESQSVVLRWLWTADGIQLYAYLQVYLSIIGHLWPLKKDSFTCQFTKDLVYLRNSSPLRLFDHFPLATAFPSRWVFEWNVWSLLWVKGRVPLPLFSLDIGESTSRSVLPSWMKQMSFTGDYNHGYHGVIICYDKE